MDAETIGAILGMACVLFAGWCYSYCWRKNVVALLPIGSITLFIGVLNIVVWSASQ